MKQTTYNTLVNAIKKDQLDVFVEHTQRLDDFLASPGAEMPPIAEVLLRSHSAIYADFLDALVQKGIGPDLPQVLETGCFDPVNILTAMSTHKTSQYKMCRAIERYANIRETPVFVSYKGKHMFRIVTGSLVGVKTVKCVMTHFGKWLGEFEQQHNIFSAFGYTADDLMFLKAKVLLEHGANPNAEEKGDGHFYNFLEWVLNSKSMPLLYLMILYGARDDGFLDAIMKSRNKKILANRFHLVRLYTQHPNNQDHVKVYPGPLHQAICLQDRALIALCLAAGADPDEPATRARSMNKVKIKKGTTARAVAEELGLSLDEIAAQSEDLFSQPDSAIDEIATALAQPEPIINAFYDVLDWLKKRDDITFYARPEGRQHIAPPDAATLEIIALLWPKPSKQQLLALNVCWYIGHQRLSWSIGDRASGGFAFFDWASLCTRGLFCAHEDIGTTFLHGKNRRSWMSFQATYNDYQYISLKLNAQQFLERLFQCAGLQYWMYCFFKQPEPRSIPFFINALDALQPSGDLNVYRQLFTSVTLDGVPIEH